MSQSTPKPAPSPAQTYEDYFVPGMFRPWAEALLQRARPQPGERILDVACGTGIVARLAAQQLNGQGTVAGLDLNPAMIEVARATSAQEGLVIEWHVGGADALPFSDGSFDLVLVQQGVQFYPDRPAAVREMYRVLAPGGRAVTATWTDISNSPLTEAIANAIQRHLGTPAMHTPFSLANRDELRSLFEQAGFTDVQIEVVQQTVRFAGSPNRFVDLGIAGSSAAVPALGTMDEAARAVLTEQVRADMSEALQRFTEGDGLAAPMEAHILTVHKP